VLRHEPLVWPTLAFVALTLAGLWMYTQPFLAIGDRTPASLLLAGSSGAVLLAVVLTLPRLLRASRLPTVVARSPVARRVDLFVLTISLQFLVTLAAWGLIPLRLWR
jgi:hypothetical protein